jgi:hypothetical protein
MENNQPYKEKIIELISKGKLEIVFDILFDIFKKNNVEKENYSHLIILKGRLAGIKQELNLGIIDRETGYREKNTISYSLLQLLGKLPDEFTNIKSTSTKTIIDKIEQTPLYKDIKTDSKYAYDFFLSFSNADELIAKNIWEILRGNGLKVFLSAEALKISAGKSFFENISNALQESKNFILFCTHESLKSEWVRVEYETFFNEFHLKDKEDRNMFILKSKEVELFDVPLLLRRLQFAESPSEILTSLNLNIIENNLLNASKKDPHEFNGKQPNHNKKSINYEADRHLFKLNSYMTMEGIAQLTSRTLNIIVMFLAFFLSVIIWPIPVIASIFFLFSKSLKYKEIGVSILIGFLEMLIVVLIVYASNILS